MTITAAPGAGGGGNKGIRPDGIEGRTGEVGAGGRTGGRTGETGAGGRTGGEGGVVQVGGAVPPPT